LSSRVFVAELRPEPAMRRVLAASALLAYGLGIVTICSLSIDVRLGALGATVWSLQGGIQWHLISSAHKRFRGLRIHCDGMAELLDNGGAWQPAIICKECIVLSRFAWLKLKPAQGGTYYELVRGRARGTSLENKQWRRLQVIWRHLGTVGRSC
jgi:hypothetical protein